MTAAAPRVRRVTTTRRGGVSTGQFTSFNLADHVGDAPEAVAANRAHLAETLGLAPDHLIWMEQVHSRTVTVVDGPRTEPVPVTDGIVTATPGLALGVLTADCVPVLLADAEAGVIAAVHAGRIGARAGIVPAALSTMVELGARIDHIEVLLGPAAGGASYEVPAQMMAEVEERLPGSASRTKAGRPALDLRAGLARQLFEAGVPDVSIDPRDTITDAELFSYRREQQTGRQAGVIWIEP